MAFHSPGHENQSKNGSNPYAKGGATKDTATTGGVTGAADGAANGATTGGAPSGASGNATSAVTGGSNTGAAAKDGVASGGAAASAPNQVPKPGQKPKQGKKGKKRKGPKQQPAQGGEAMANQKAGAQNPQNANTKANTKSAGNGADNAAQGGAKNGARQGADTSAQMTAAKGAAKDSQKGAQKSTQNKPQQRPQEKAQKGAGSRSGQSWKSAFSGATAQAKDGRVYEERSIMHIDPISALKVGFLLSASLFLVWIVAAVVIYMGLGIAGVWDKLNGLIGDLTGSGEFGFGTYSGVVFVLGLVELVILTLLAPVAAVAYNASAQLLGGLRIKLDN